jgi:hypothetical protein
MIEKFFPLPRFRLFCSTIPEYFADKVSSTQKNKIKEDRHGEEEGKRREKKNCLVFLAPQFLSVFIAQVSFIAFV